MATTKKAKPAKKTVKKTVKKVVKKVAKKVASETAIEEVKIGDQIWMAKNLDVTHFRNGDPIPQAKSDAEWEEAGENKQPAWCYYNNDAENGKKYGKLYNWYAVKDSRGLAPSGYHIPTDKEWTQLSDYLGGEDKAGDKMKSTSGWEDNGNGTNRSGFSGLPGGYRNLNLLRSFNSVGNFGYWWSSTESSTTSAWGRYLYWYDGDANRNDGNKRDGFSVRCIRAKKVSKKTISKSKVKNQQKSEQKKTNIQPYSENKRVSESTFLFIGTLTRIDRKGAEKMVTDLGGKIVSKVSDKLDYLIVGENPGSKLKQADKISSIRILSDGAFMQLINYEKDLVNNVNNNTSESTETKYRLKYYVYGYGGEHCIASLDKTQIDYWKKKYKEDSYDASKELKDHVWNADWDDEVPPTHFGKWYNNDNCLHEEKVYYSESSTLCVEVYNGDEQIEELEITVTDKSLKKSFYDEFVPNKKKEKGNAYLWCRSSDRGSYCYGETELEEGEVFDKSKLSISVGKIFDDQVVTYICYDDISLDDEGCYDSTGKGFDADIIFY